MDTIEDIVGGAVGILVGTIFAPIQLLADVFAGMAQAVLDLLPDAADLGLDVPEGWIHGYTFMNTLLPLSEALAFGAAIMAVVLAGLAFRIGVTVYHLIPKPLVGT